MNLRAKISVVKNSNTDQTLFLIKIFFRSGLMPVSNEVTQNNDDESAKLHWVTDELMSKDNWRLKKYFWSNFVFVFNKI